MTTTKGPWSRCPYPDCPFIGTDAEVDEHRATGIHNDEEQAGSNV